MLRRGKGRAVVGLAVVTAAPLLGLVPLPGVAGTAAADGPVQAQPRERRAAATVTTTVKHRVHKHRHHRKQRQQLATAARAKPGTFDVHTAAPGVPLVPGRTYNWPFAVTGKGPLDAGPTVFTTTLPESLEFVSGSQNCSFSSAGSGKGGRAVCQLGEVGSGETVAGVFTAKVATSAKPREHVTSTAVVTSGRTQTTEEFPASIVADVADVSLAKKGPGTVRPGEVVSYTTTVRNTGPGVAEEVVVTSSVPAEVLENDSACTRTETSDAKSPYKSSVYLCEVGSLPAGKSKTIHTRVMPKNKPGTAVLAPSAATTKTYEVNTANNRASVRTRIARPAAVAPAAHRMRKVRTARAAAAPALRPRKPAERPAVTAPAVPGQQLRELPRTGVESSAMVDASLALVGGGLILSRLARARRRPQD
ncbi:DUF11 domain-containing protein [Actinomadura hibisca]|uniref:DUF11 domain-containing protein n=1 Tax=Actinomadura hibisca TaxID=68565 RepID=UPI000836D72C|nr:DUF11 domain-containing protein [Actinomadura hibisca]